MQGTLLIPPSGLYFVADGLGIADGLQSVTRLWLFLRSALTLFMFLIKSVPTVQGKHLVSSFIQVNPPTNCFLRYFFLTFFFWEVSSIHRPAAVIHTVSLAKLRGQVCCQEAAVASHSGVYSLKQWEECDRKEQGIILKKSIIICLQYVI